MGRATALPEAVCGYRPSYIRPKAKNANTEPHVRDGRMRVLGGGRRVGETSLDLLLNCAGKLKLLKKVKFRKKNLKYMLTDLVRYKDAKSTRPGSGDTSLRSAHRPSGTQDGRPGKDSGPTRGIFYFENYFSGPRNTCLDQLRRNVVFPTLNFLPQRLPFIERPVYANL